MVSFATTFASVVLPTASRLGSSSTTIALTTPCS
jgi:hypothetical protein